MDTTADIVSAAILVIGDEILSGRTKDKNIGYIAEYLTNIGIELREVRVVPDVTEEIVAALNALQFDRHRPTSAAVAPSGFRRLVLWRYIPPRNHAAPHGAPGQFPCRLTQACHCCGCRSSPPWPHPSS